METSNQERVQITESGRARSNQWEEDRLEAFRTSMDRKASMKLGSLLGRTQTMDIWYNLLLGYEAESIVGVPRGSKEGQGGRRGVYSKQT